MRILREKNSRDGWECGEGERTVLRKLDPCEDGGGRLRGDFDRLRGVSHTPQASTLTFDTTVVGKKSWGKPGYILHSS